MKSHHEVLEMSHPCLISDQEQTSWKVLLLHTASKHFQDTKGTLLSMMFLFACGCMSSPWWWWCVYGGVFHYWVIAAGVKLGIGDVCGWVPMCQHFL